MGIVVSIVDNETCSGAQSIGEHETVIPVVLDDGSALVAILVSKAMIRAIDVQKGKTIDCLVQLHGEVNAAESFDVFGLSGEPSLVAFQLARVDDVVAAETLRAFEIEYQTKIDQQKRDGQTSSTVECGYPSPFATIDEDDVFDIIQSESRLVPQEEKPSNYLGRTHYKRQSKQNSSTSQKRTGGVTLKELMTVLDLDHTEALHLIEELQLSGRIYQDSRGRYLPL